MFDFLKALLKKNFSSNYYTQKKIYSVIYFFKYQFVVFSKALSMLMFGFQSSTF